MITLVIAPQDTTTIGYQIFRTVGQISDRILSYAIALAAVGALAMALIEAWKKLRDTRARFHARRWTEVMFPSNMNPGTVRMREIAYRQLLQLSTGATATEVNSALMRLKTDDLNKQGLFHSSPAYAVFVQETTVMMTMIQDSVDVALGAAPGSYIELFGVMVEGANQSDIDDWLNRGNIAAPNAVQARDLGNVYGRLRQVAKRRLDGFQVVALERWAAGNQVASNILGTVLMAGAVTMLVWDRPGFWSGTALVELIFLCLTGGILAPVAKDLVTALKKVKEQ
jgi:hypothetical protein